MSQSTKQNRSETLSPHDAVGMVYNTALAMQVEALPELEVRYLNDGIAIFIPGYTIEDGSVIKSTVSAA